MGKIIASYFDPITKKRVDICIDKTLTSTEMAYIKPAPPAPATQNKPGDIDNLISGLKSGKIRNVFIPAKGSIQSK